MARSRVEIARRLICQYQRRTHRQRARNRHTLLLTAGKLRRHTITLVGNMQCCEQFINELGIDGHAIQCEWKNDIVPDIEIGDEVVLLKDEADATTTKQRQLGTVQHGKIVAVDNYAAACRDIQTAKHMQERRFAAA